MYGLGRMTSTHKGISGMALENKTSPRPISDGAFMPHVEGDLNGPSYRTAGKTTLSHPSKMVVLHWLTVVCLAATVAFILTRDEIDGRAMRMWLLEGHRHFGLLVLLLFFVRVVLRIRLGKLPSDGNMSWPMRAAAGLTHIAMYAALVAMPLIGWALSNAQDKPVHFLGATLPALVGADEDLADTLQAWHLNVAWALLALVSLHVLAALWHHFVLRDGVLRMMLPKRRR
jgi:cytochrome b561